MTRAVNVPEAPEGLADVTDRSRRSSVCRLSRRRVFGVLIFAAWEFSLIPLEVFSSHACLRMLWLPVSLPLGRAEGASGAAVEEREAIQIHPLGGVILRELTILAICRENEQLSEGV